MLAANAAASPADEAKAIEKLRAASAAIEAEGLLRWTENDIPRYAEEPLVMMAAAMAAADFDRPADPAWAGAMRMIVRGVNLRTTSTVRAEYF